ncbi:MAG: hypothetical protein RBR43_03630 [Desulfuromonadaceae bacterium]|nr:hypothetical protein [Desulfuromonas sp.]MDY0184958.1 hypothetical protein [Desulfuromonadaceae bacterium]
MKVKQWFSFCALLCSILLLSACGSNSGSGGDKNAPPAGGDLGKDEISDIKYVGTDKCIGCHDDFSWSADIVDAYLMGKHVIHSDHITAANKADGCLVCHDPIGDGPLLEALISAANVPTEGLAAIGCEACHGAGGDHWGIGPMPIAKPLASACATCHDKLPEDHLRFHPEADNIATNFYASRHNTASVRESARCSKCHTDEGGRLYKGVSTKTQLDVLVQAVTSKEPVQCKTCHDPHHAGGLLLDKVESRGTLIASAEYATCTNCHMSDRDDPSDAEWMYHAGDYARIITDTHYDNPATPDVIEGYTLDKRNNRSCRDCHDVHAVMDIRSGNTIHEQWAQSRHAGTIGAIKNAAASTEANGTVEQTLAIKGAGVPASSSWPHYDWDAGDRQGCQKCHTSTGFANFASNPAGYIAANNDFSHLDGWKNDAGAITSSGQNELLYCWGCHSDNSGALRNTGAVTVDYTVDGVNPILADIGASNVCVTCHVGQGNMDTLIDNASANPAKDISALKPGFGPGTKNVTITHYLATAATIFQAETRIGYEYPGQSYADPAYFAHNNIDVTGAGPCVACHMETNEPHAWKIVTKDSAGTITALNATSCVECHSGSHGAALVVDNAAAAALLQGEAQGFHEALEILENALIAKGLTFTGNYPYFSGASWTNEGNIGAAHNFNYLHHEPGAYAHNRVYTKRLIFDSIDWVDNYAIDGSISFNANAYPAAAVWFGAEGGVVNKRP